MLKSKSKRDTLMGYLFSAPAIFIYSIFTIYPFFYGIYISMSEWDGFNDPKFIGFDNFINLFHDPVVFESLSRNVVFAIGSVVIKIVLAFFIALLLNRSLKSISMFRTIFFAPVVISFVAVGVLWTWILNPNQGILNNLLVSLHLMDPDNKIAWLSDPTMAMIALIIVDVWKWTGYHVVLFLAGLQTISSDLYESAGIDGASGFKKMLYVTIPQIKSVFYINLTFCLIGAFGVFDIVKVMTNGGPYGKTQVIALYIYNTSFGSTNKFGYATSISIFVFILMLIVTIILLRRMRKVEESM